MKRSVSLLVIFSVFSFTSVTASEGLTTCVYRSLNGDAAAWQEGVPLLVREKAKVRTRYDEALRLLAGWYNIDASDEAGILDGLVQHEGFAPGACTRWQVSALLIIALQGQPTGAAQASSSKLRIIWRFLTGTWYGLVLAALVVYYGWRLLSTLFPALANLLKKLRKGAKGTQACSAPTFSAHDAAASFEVAPVRAQREEPEEERRQDLTPWLHVKGSPREPWLDSMGAFPPPPPDEGPGAGAVACIGDDEVRSIGQQVGDCWRGFRDWWRRDGNGQVVREVTTTGAAVAVAAAIAKASLAAQAAYGAMSGTQKVAPPVPSSSPTDKEQFEYAVRRGLVPMGPAGRFTTEQLEALAQRHEVMVRKPLKEMQERVSALENVATVGVPVAVAVGGACGYGYKTLQERRAALRAKGLSSCPHCHQSDESAADDHQR